MPNHIIYELLYFDLECNSLFKRNLVSLVCLFLHSIHGLCNGDQKIQRFLTFLTDSDVRHIFYLYKGKKWFIGHLFHYLNTFCKVSRFKRAYFEFSIDLKKMQFLNASQKRHKMQMLRWKATLLAISEEWKPFCYILWTIQGKR